MICSNCGSNNNDNNRFCITCGVEISHDENNNRIHCPKCGFDNIIQSKYCVACGKSLNKKQVKVHHSPPNPFKSKKQRIKEKRNINGHTHHGINRKNSSGFKTLWISVAVVIGSILIAISFELLFIPKAEEIPVERKSNNAAVEANVYEIASKFICSCGTCNNQTLEVSRCDVAIEERQLIRNYLEQNQKPDDIVIKVANKYGWLKPEFASFYKVDASKIWNQKEKKISKDIIPDSPLTTRSNLQSEPWNKVCPIEGDPVYSGVSTVEYNGKIYGLCCEDCQTEFRNVPEKYLKNLSENGSEFIGS